MITIPTTREYNDSSKQRNSKTEEQAEKAKVILTGRRSNKLTSGRIDRQTKKGK